MPVQPGVDYDRPSSGGSRQVQNPCQEDRRPRGLDRREPRRRDLAEVRRHQRRQRRGPVELLQGRPGGLSRHRFQLQRQGRPVSLVPHRRQPLGPESERGRRDRVLEGDFRRGGHRRGDCGHRHARRRSVRTADAHAGRIEVARAGQGAGGGRGREDRQSHGRLQSDVGPAEGGRAAIATWVQFSANRPGVVPAGTDESTKDLRVYENVDGDCGRAAESTGKCRSARWCKWATRGG